MTTKPHVSGTPYIRKMSDCCGDALDPVDTCPISDLYRAFLERHRTQLEGNRRLALCPLASAGRRDEGKQGSDRRVFAAVRRCPEAGEVVTPGVVRRARDAR